MTVQARIIQLVTELVEDDGVDVSVDTCLIGGNRVLKSRQLVELCLGLEDYADELGFEFDWTSEAAMSQSRSIFRSVRTLAEHFEKQRSAV